MKFLKSKPFLLVLFLTFCALVYMEQGAEGAKICLIGGIFGFTLAKTLGS